MSLRPLLAPGHMCEEELAGKFLAPGEFLAFLQEERFDVATPVYATPTPSSVDPIPNAVNLSHQRTRSSLASAPINVSRSHLGRK